MEELFSMAETLMTNERFQDAALIFREAAISYRISASRNATHWSGAEGRAQWMVTARNIYANWIRQNPQGFSSIPRRLPGIDHDFIMGVALTQLLEDEYFSDVARFVDQAVSGGKEFYASAGATTMPRRIGRFVGEVYGLSPVSLYLSIQDVRIGIDQIADAVEEIYNQGIAKGGH